MSDFAKKVTHFLHPHYVFNVFLSVIFFGLKSIDPFCSALFDDCHLELVDYCSYIIAQWHSENVNLVEIVDLEH